jgi:hypothetical protein
VSLAGPGELVRFVDQGAEAQDVAVAGACDEPVAGAGGQEVPASLAS